MRLLSEQKVPQLLTELGDLLLNIRRMRFVFSLGVDYVG
jgi:hypothetical protein